MEVLLMSTCYNTLINYKFGSISNAATTTNYSGQNSYTHLIKSFQYKLPVDGFKFDSKFYQSSYPFSILINKNGYFCNAPDIELFVHSDSLDGLINEIACEIDWSWEFYVCADNSQLDGSAIRLKNKLKKYFCLVENGINK